MSIISYSYDLFCGVKFLVFFCFLKKKKKVLVFFLNASLLKLVNINLTFKYIYKIVQDNAR